MDIDEINKNVNQLTSNITNIMKSDHTIKLVNNVIDYCEDECIYETFIELVNKMVKLFNSFPPHLTSGVNNKNKEINGIEIDYEDFFNKNMNKSIVSTTFISILAGFTYTIKDESIEITIEKFKKIIETICDNSVDIDIIMHVFDIFDKESLELFVNNKN